MWARTAGPRLEDFGITEDDLARAPRLFLASHRPVLLAAIYLAVVALVFAGILRAGHSWTAAIFFAVILVAAGSVLLLPAAMLALCAGERVEERWLCRQAPFLRACLAYQRAAEEHRARAAKDSTIRPSTADDWCGCSPMTFRSEVGRLLDRRGGGEVRIVDRESTGFDFLVDARDRRILLRCEPGSGPLAAAAGRELVASLGDHCGDAAVIVTAAALSLTLEDYIADRPISVVAPWRLEEELRRPTAPG